MQKIGICTWILGIKDLEQLMSKVKSMGLDSVQYCESMDTHSAKAVKSAAEKFGLSILIYDPFDCRPGPDNGAASIENALAYFRRAINFAAELGCGLTLQGLGAWTENCKDDAAAWHFLVNCLKALAVYAQERRVPLSYEPCNLYEVPYIHTADEYQRLIDESNCHDISVLLDSFHMNIGEKEPTAVLKQYADKLSFFHISGSNREGIAQGHIDFKAQYDALVAGGFSGPCVIECVLRDNPVNTPPRNEKEMTRLTDIIMETRKIWQGFGTCAT